jgi:NitT/TauT family transport system substrate-binding protein
MRGSMRVPALLLAVSLIFLSAGCAGGAGGSSVTGVPVLPKVGGLEKTTLNVAVVPSIDAAGFYVAMHEGLFSQEGLRINYTPAYDYNVIRAQAKGQFDISFNNYVTYIEAQLSQQANLRIFAEGSLLQPGSDVVMVLPHSRIQSLQQLTGHVLGVNSGPNIGYLLVASMLSENRLSVKATPGFSATSVMLPPSQNFPFPATRPLLSGQVAAAIMSEPYATQLAVQTGAAVIADADSGATSQFPMLGYAVTKAWAKANPNALKAFTIALEAGQEAADTNRAAVEAAFEALPQGAGHIDPLIAALMALNYYPLGVDPVRLQRVADVMQQFGLLHRRFNIGQLLN